ncbi:coiled-coil domain-containing protein 120 isoform X2 [Chiroxiphia lanceolata]|uniref:coiled-coil domain-containing protein 120 isoform X2 n=1 Tax=Chiroxiphia lanceolata TaxID=296741 RepID=UPI0013CE81BC|nr:coiled-coil domain-containing protein 120 isoform X2 [Chiroxiphia lanceolata]
MEVRGHIIPPGTYSPAGAAAGRLQELRERQRGLRQALGLRLRELRRLCLQEAELTGKLPPEYPLEPGERPQPPPRRRSGVPPRGPLPEAGRARREAAAQVQVQAQVVEAARRMAAVPGLPPEQRRRRQRLQAEAAQRLQQLRAQLGPPGQDENGSLCDLPVLENGALPPLKPPQSGGGRPSPPRGGSSSPDRRPPWTPDVPLGGPGRRSSLASPASPARTLPRSASSFEGRSVPATPVLARSPCARGHPLGRPNPEAPGLPPRPWSGSQDSQLGGPPAPGPPLPTAPRTRRSNSSEALIDWGGPPAAAAESTPEASRGRGGCPPNAHPPPPPPLLGRAAAPQPEVVGAGGAAGLVPAAHGDPPGGPPPPGRTPPPAAPRARLGPPPTPRPPRPAPLAQLRRGPGAQGLRGHPWGHPPSPRGPTAPRHPGVTPQTRGVAPPDSLQPSPGYGEGSPQVWVGCP